MKPEQTERFELALRQAFAAWPNVAHRVDATMVQAWFAFLREYELEDILDALRKLSTTEEWAPPLAKVVGLVKISDRQRRLAQRIAAEREEKRRAFPLSFAEARSPDVRAEHDAKWRTETAKLQAQGMSPRDAAWAMITRNVEQIAEGMDMNRSWQERRRDRRRRGSFLRDEEQRSARGGSRDE